MSLVDNMLAATQRDRLHRARCALPSGPIPADVYWSADSDNFYFADTQEGMGDDFYRSWRPRASEFPTNSAAAIL